MYELWVSGPKNEEESFRFVSGTSLCGSPSSGLQICPEWIWEAAYIPLESRLCHQVSLTSKQAVTFLEACVLVQLVSMECIFVTTPKLDCQ